MFTSISRREILSASLALATTGCFPVKNVGGKRFYADGLSFLPDDMNQIGASAIDAMICDVSVVEEVRDPDGTPRYKRTFTANDAAIDRALAKIATHPNVYLAKHRDDLDPSRGCAVVLQMQSAEVVGQELNRLQHFYDKGLRVLQFTHHNNTDWAGGCLERKPTGLTALGYEGLSEINRLGILPDVAHGSEQTMLDVATTSKTPIAMSHGACRTIVNHPRCITDRAIKMIAERGGVVGIFMMSFWLTSEPTPRPEHFINHIRHVINVGGIDAVAIANDFPMAGQSNLLKLGNDNKEGVKEYLEWWRAMDKLGLPGFAKDPEHVVIPELNSIDRMERIEMLLEREKMPAGHIDKIMGQNWRRILTDVALR